MYIDSSQSCVMTRDRIDLKAQAPVNRHNSQDNLCVVETLHRAVTKAMLKSRVGVFLCFV